MTIIEALQALKDGKKICKRDWYNGTYLFAETIFKFRTVCWNEDGKVEGYTHLIDLDADDWELYAEPVRITPEERKALELAKACGFEWIRFHENFAKLSEDEFCAAWVEVCDIPAMMALAKPHRKFELTETPVSIDELLKGGAE